MIANLCTYQDHIEGYFICLDQAKAFHRVNHDYLFKTLEKMGFNGPFLNLTKELYNNITSQMSVNGT